MSDWNPPVDTGFADHVAQGLAGAFKDAAGDAIDQFGLPLDFDWLEPKAIDYGKKRGGELIGKKLVDGVWVDNPNAEWVIDDFAREKVNGIIADAIEEGLSPQDFARELEESGIFGEARAEMIARTEAAIAMNRGKAGAMREADVNYVYIYDGDGDEECEELNDTVQTLDWFEANPVGHPNCLRDGRPATQDELVEEGYDADANVSPIDDEEGAREAA